MITLSTPAAISQLAAIKASMLDGGSVDLYTNNLRPGPGSQIGDFQIANWAGYTPRATGTWPGPYVNNQGGAWCFITLAPWFGPGSGGGQAAYGFLLRSAGGVLVAAGAFGGGPVPMAGASSMLLLTLRYSLGPTPAGKVEVFTTGGGAGPLGPTNATVIVSNTGAWLTTGAGTPLVTGR
jgi:hypothetical protein